MASLEETLKKSQNKCGKLSDEKLKEFADTIEESSKTLSPLLKDLPAVISSLKEVSTKQTENKEKILSIISASERKISTSVEMLSEKFDELAQKVDSEIIHAKDELYVKVSYGQFLWFVFGILVLSCVQAGLRNQSNKDASDFGSFLGLLTIAWFILIIVFNLINYFYP